MTSETVVPILALIQTCFGFMLGLCAFVFLLRGTKVPTQPDAPHKIVFKGLEVQTDRVVMLLIVCVIAMVLPFLGYMWLGSKALPLKDLELNVIATIEERPGMLAQDASVSFARIGSGRREVLCSEGKAASGMFSCSTSLESLQDKFELRVSKSGYFDHIKRVIPTQPDLVITLQKRER